MKNKNFRNVDFPALIDAGYEVTKFLHYYPLDLKGENLGEYPTAQAAWIAAQEHSGLPFIPDYHGAVKAGYYVEPAPTSNAWLRSQFAAALHPDYVQGHIDKWMEASDKLSRS